MFSSRIVLIQAIGISFLVGAAGASLETRVSWLPYMVGGCFIALFALFVWGHRQGVVHVSLLIVACLLGMVRFTAELIVSPSSIVRLQGHSEIIEGVIREEPDRRIAETKYVVVVDRHATSTQLLTGRIQVAVPRYPEYYYGDRVRLACKVKVPEVSADGFRYDKYLAGQGIDALCERPMVERIAQRQGSKIISLLFDSKSFIAQHIEMVWSEPYSSFMAGILYGSRAGLPPDLTDLFNRTGVTHIIAVSGANISIIAVALMSIMFALRMHRRVASWGAGVFIVAFVIFTGASASVVRAGIMGCIAILAKMVGRPVRMSMVLMVTAVIMALSNPYVLVWDAGFQLSFLSTMGLVYISPLLMRVVPLDRWPKLVTIFVENGITTIAAIAATLPLMLFQFGRLSLVAPIANVLILWAIPYSMLCGFIATVVGIFSVPLGLVISIPSVVLMKYVLYVVHTLGSLPWASFDFKVSWWVMMILYILLIGFVVYVRRRFFYGSPKNRGHV